MGSGEKRNDEQRRQQSSKRHEKSAPNKQSPLKETFVQTEFVLTNANKEYFHVEVLSIDDQGKQQCVDPTKLTFTGQRINPQTGEQELMVKIGRHQFAIKTMAGNDPMYNIKPGTAFSTVPIEGAEFVPGMGWRIPPKPFWRQLSVDDWIDLAYVSISTLSTIFDGASVPKESIRQSLRPIAESIKQSKIGKIGSEWFRVAKTATQEARDFVAEEYNAFKQGVRNLFGKEDAQEGFVKFGKEILPNKTLFTSDKLQHSFKHASDFGITGNWNKVNGELYQQAIQQHLSSATNILKSTYRGQEVLVYINKNTGLGAYTDLVGNYIGGWKFNVDQMNFHLTNGIKILGE